jgi:thiol-disulfide isomerase/thioredoxin
MFNLTWQSTAAMLLLATAACSTVVGAPPASTARPATGAGDVRLAIKNHDQLMELIATKRGKIVVVDVWSTFCDPCVKEFPGLVRLHKKYAPEKIACLSLCVNFSGLGKPEDEIEEPLQFLKAQGAVFDNVLSSEPDETLYKKLKIATVPTILVFGRDGKLLKAFENEVKYSEVEAFIVPLLGSN